MDMDKMPTATHNLATFRMACPSFLSTPFRQNPLMDTNLSDPSHICAQIPPFSIMAGLVASLPASSFLIPHPSHVPPFLLLTLFLLSFFLQNGQDSYHLGRFTFVLSFRTSIFALPLVLTLHPVLSEVICHTY